MKVLFTFGGIPHYLNAMLNKLHKKGVEVVVVTPQKGNNTIGKGVKMVEAEGYKQIQTPEKKMYYGKSAFPALPDIIQKEQPQLVVLGWPYFLQVFFQPELRKCIKRLNIHLMIREIPFQVPPYGQIRSYFKAHPMYNEEMKLLSKGWSFYLKQWLTAQIRKFCYSHVSGTLNYSTAAYDVLPSYGVKKEAIYVTFNATDTNALLREKENIKHDTPLLPPSSQRILHIGRLVKWKRVDLLIDAFQQLLPKFKEAELVIIGNGPELENLKRQAETLQIASSVRFIGAVYNPEELGKYMLESTVYTLAGMGGLSINDAMTYGLPIVCSVCDSTEQDLVRDGENGFLFKENDATDLAEKLSRLLADPERCKTMGQVSEEIIREQINIDTVSERYIKAFQHVLHQ